MFNQHKKCNDKLSVEAIEKRDSTIAEMRVRDAIANKDKTLVLDYLCISKFPDGLKDCVDITSVHASYCNLTTLNGISDVPQITVLIVNKNHLTDLTGIDGLVNLEMLCANENRIAKIPSEIKNCKKLRVLDLFHNWIKSLPSELSDCSSLFQLNVASNDFEEKPDVSLLTKLTCFYW